MFRAIFLSILRSARLFYSLWYNAPMLLLAGGLERGGTDYVFGMKDVARQSALYHKL